MLIAFKKNLFFPSHFFRIPYKMFVVEQFLFWLFLLLLFCSVNLFSLLQHVQAIILFILDIYRQMTKLYSISYFICARTLILCCVVFDLLLFSCVTFSVFFFRKQNEKKNGIFEIKREVCLHNNNRQHRIQNRMHFFTLSFDMRQDQFSWFGILSLNIVFIFKESRKRQTVEVKKKEKHSN